MLNALEKILRTQTNRFFQSRLHNMYDELRHIDDQIEELQTQRNALIDDIDFCESRIST